MNSGGGRLDFGAAISAPVGSYGLWVVVVVGASPSVILGVLLSLSNPYMDLASAGGTRSAVIVHCSFAWELESVYVLAAASIRVCL